MCRTEGIRIIGSASLFFAARARSSFHEGIFDKTAASTIIRTLSRKTPGKAIVVE
jgi:hypothetical protein